jgi:hypothetical protein
MKSQKFRGSIPTQANRPHSRCNTKERKSGKGTTVAANVEGESGESPVRWMARRFCYRTLLYGFCVPRIGHLNAYKDNSPLCVLVTARIPEQVDNVLAQLTTSMRVLNCRGKVDRGPDELAQARDDRLLRIHEGVFKPM